MEPDMEAQVHSDLPRRVSFEGNHSNAQQRPHRSDRTARLIADEVRLLVSKTFKGEITSMLTWRTRWKRISDICESLGKCLSGVGSVLAFAASAEQNVKHADILAFTSGTVGTTALVLLMYAAYASRESRQRTTEGNELLKSIGVTPMPQIALEDVEIGD